VLRVLRDELASVRRELNHFNSILDSTSTQAELNAFAKRINESFDAIVPEALLTDAERRRRTIASVLNLVTPVRQLYSLAIDPLSASSSQVVEAYESAQKVVKRESRIVTRSVSATKFSDLMKVESVRGLLQTHFTRSELALLQLGQ
jgi:hypothetical protein